MEPCGRTSLKFKASGRSSIKRSPGKLSIGLLIDVFRIDLNIEVRVEVFFRKKSLCKLKASERRKVFGERDILEKISYRRSGLGEVFYRLKDFFLKYEESYRYGIEKVFFERERERESE